MNTIRLNFRKNIMSPGHNIKMVLKNVAVGLGVSAILAVALFLAFNGGKGGGLLASLLGGQSPDGGVASGVLTKLTIIKDTDPNDDEDFLFDFFDTRKGYESWGSEFTLDDDSIQQNPWSNTGIFNFEFEPLETRPVLIREKLTDDQKLKYETSFVCTNTTGFTFEGKGNEILMDYNGTGKRIEEGDDWTCIFTNKLRVNPDLATIKVLKDTNPNSSEYFKFQINNIYSQKIQDEFFLDDDGNSTNRFSNEHTTIVEADSLYSVVEDNLSTAYEATYYCEGTDPAGNVKVYPSSGFKPQKDEIVFCIVTNTRQSDIKVTKQTDPSGNAEAFNFRITVPTPSPLDYSTEDFKLKDGETKTKQLRNKDLHKTFTIEEIPATPNIYNTTFSCIFTPGVNGIQRSQMSGETLSVNIILSAGELVHCTFKNTVKPPDPLAEPVIKIIKEGNIDKEFEFSILYSGLRQNVYLNPKGKNTETRYIDSGSAVKIEEFEQDPTEKAKYDTTYKCSDGQVGTGTVVNLAPLSDGDLITCTFNNKIKEQPTITVIKNTEPNSPDAFNLNVFVYSQNNIERNIVKDFPLIDDGSGNQNIKEINYHELGQQRVIKYRIVESFDPTKYEATYRCVFVPATSGQPRIDYVGSGGEVKSPSGAPGLVLDPGEKVTCTFTNKLKPKPTITVVKTTVPALLDEYFTVNLVQGLNTFPPLIYNTAKNLRTYTQPVEAGVAFTITEDSVSGVVTSYKCSNGQSGYGVGPINVAGLNYGAKLTCTFTNCRAINGSLCPITPDDDDR